jgi:imidazolonepropionase-like amidohydrolase
LHQSAKLAVQLHRSGGLVGIGTDFPIDGLQAGESVHRELELLVELGGATTLEALQMATIRSAEILGFEELLGTVEAGQLAHLVVLTKNPLENISNVRSILYVVHDGRLCEPGSSK